MCPSDHDRRDRGKTRTGCKSVGDEWILVRSARSTSRQQRRVQAKDQDGAAVIGSSIATRRCPRASCTAFDGVRPPFDRHHQPCTPAVAAACALTQIAQIVRQPSRHRHLRAGGREPGRPGGLNSCSRSPALRLATREVQARTPQNESSAPRLPLARIEHRPSRRRSPGAGGFTSHGPWTAPSTMSPRTRESVLRARLVLERACRPSRCRNCGRGPARSTRKGAGGFASRGPWTAPSMMPPARSSKRAARSTRARADLPAVSTPQLRARPHTLDAQGIAELRTVLTELCSLKPFVEVGLERECWRRR